MYYGDGMNVLYYWETFPTFLLPSIKLKVCKSTLQAILIKHTKWQPIRQPEPMQIITLKESRIEAGVLV